VAAEDGVKQYGNPKVQGRCPACGSSSLFLGNGGYVTCSVIECAMPLLASRLLESTKLHRIVQEVLRATGCDADARVADEPGGEGVGVK